MSGKKSLVAVLFTGAILLLVPDLALADYPPNSPLTNGATSTGPTTATLHGSVRPGGNAGTTTTVWFQYAPAADVFCTSGGATSGTESQTPDQTIPGSYEDWTSISADVSGLITGQAYCFNFVATNYKGSVTSATDTFTAGGAPPPADTDGDGVPDSSDACPSTPAATANGCPATPPASTPSSSAPPDADGDGVADSSDGCPSTAGPSSNSGCPINAFTFAGKALLKNGYTILQAKVPGPGKLTAAQAKVTKKTPALIKKVSVTTSKAGKVSLKLKPTAAGKKLLAEQGKLAVKVKVSYTPTGGKPNSAVKPVVLKRVKYIR